MTRKLKFWMTTLLSPSKNTIFFFESRIWRPWERLAEIFPRLGEKRENKCGNGVLKKMMEEFHVFSVSSSSVFSQKNPHTFLSGKFEGRGNVWRKSSHREKAEKRTYGEAPRWRPSRSVLAWLEM